MLTAERRRFIMQLLERDGKIVAKELSATLSLSEDTIRRDLRDMSSEGLLQRVHGGALPRSPALASFAERQDQAPGAKAAIARAAAQLIHDGLVVLMDGGTTNVGVARFLPRDLRATIVTNSPPLAAALAQHRAIEVIMLGGRLDHDAMVTMGTATVEQFSMVRADLYLLGVCSVHPEVGLSTGNLEEAYLKRLMMSRAAEVVALVSPEKLNTAAPYMIAPIDDLSEIITEAHVSDEVLAPYRALGVTVTRA